MTVKMRHSTDLQVCRRSHQFFLNVVQEASNLPRGSAAEVIARQLFRGVGSISANIAEGFNRTRKQFINYLEAAKDSGFESENWHYEIRDCWFMEKATGRERIKECSDVCKMLQSLLNELRKGR